MSLLTGSARCSVLTTLAAGAILWAQETPSGNPTVVCSSTATTPSAGTTDRGQLNCSQPGVAALPFNVQFSAEAALPLNAVLAPTPPTLPADIFADINAGRSQLRQVVSFTGNILTVSLSSVATGAPLPTPVGLPLPPGSLLNRIRIQVQHVVVTNSPATILWSGVVLAPDTTSGGATPLAPTAFGDLAGRAAAVSLGFGNPISFPLLGTAAATGATGTGLDPTGAVLAAGANNVGVLVAGSFAWSSPTGFVKLSFPSATGGPGTQPPPTAGPKPTIKLTSVPNQPIQGTLQLDASPSTAAGGGTLTFAWTLLSGGVVNITGANTATPTFQFGQEGQYLIQLTATDSTGASSTFIIPVQVGF